MTSRKKQPVFNELMADLEVTVEQLENNEQPLEESLKAFEKGIALTRAAQKLLAEAEQQVILLTESDDGPEAAEFDPEDDA
ncbi:MAG: exodeoxyribonuclease VII small subunit [Halioglobus sp.]|nr:exodeoxyribonuclease VII small subunit [Halioglobus sp.]